MADVRAHIQVPGCFKDWIDDMETSFANGPGPAGDTAPRHPGFPFAAWATGPSCGENHASHDRSEGRQPARECDSQSQPQGHVGTPPAPPEGTSTPRPSHSRCGPQHQGSRGHHSYGPNGWGFGHGRCGRGRGGFGPQGGRHHGPAPSGNPFADAYGDWGRSFFGREGMQQSFDMGAFADKLARSFGYVKDPNSTGKAQDKADKDFTPLADVFDTPAAFIVHISLPGAKKEDVAVRWNADTSELTVTGVVYRPGDEETLKTLALDEREVGVFEKSIRLGGRASPAAVDADAITAKMEDGVLIVRAPQTEEFVEVKKVDIE